MKNIQVLLLCCFLPFFVQAQLQLSVETGAVFSQYNDVRIPNGETSNGTRFSLQDDFSPVPLEAFFRAELSYLISDRHTIELTAAPLAYNYQDATLNTIDFAGTTFSGEGINGRYEFNTYRLSYRYRVVLKPKFILDLGASLLARDARIAVIQGSVEADDVDLGFVPLISFALDYAPTDRISLLLKGDALVGPVGRAEDIFGGVLVHFLDDHLQLKLGYRFIEGGADVDQVFNFAFFHFADLGVVYRM